MDDTEEYFDRWSKGIGKEESESDRGFPLFLRWGIDEIISRIRLIDGSVVLDLGTGGGTLIFQMVKVNKKCKFIGIDISKGQLDNARKGCRKEGIDSRFIQGPMDDIPMESESVDIVVSSAAVHHVEDKRKLFSEIHRVLRKGGMLAFADYFEVAGKRFREQVDDCRRRHPESAKAFSRSIQDTEDQIPDDLKGTHPREYHVDPYELAGIIRDSGFRKVEVVKSFDAFFAVLSAEK
jgi:ubiquinone/menaquinone biosynthesis C-methylase UbiE